MEFFRRINRRRLLQWSLLLSLLLLCSQGATLHVHNLDHGHDGHLQHTHTTDEGGAHTRLSKAHYAHDRSHAEYHDNIVSEVEVAPEGVLKSLSSKILTLALLAILFTLLLPAPSRQLPHRRRESRLTLHRHHLLSPPLRAPPH